MKKRLLCACLLMLCSTALQAATVYRWVDDSGRVHFSDQPQGNVVETVEVPGSRRYPHAETQPPAVSSGGESTSPAANNTAAAGDGDEKRRRQMRRKNCQIAKDNLARNARISRMYRVTADGGRQYLSEAEREAVLEKSRRQVREWCD
ncbi:MAG: DUF4124 domain-containing protein [Gammaproteobacteria bacterium]